MLNPLLLIQIAVIIGLLIILVWLSIHFKSRIKNLTLKLQNESKEKFYFFSQLADIKKELDFNIRNDIITGLPSRSVLEDRLLQLIHQSQRYQLSFGLLLLDIDNFHSINAALGHPMGDSLLKEVASRLKEALKKIDTICRFTSDNFVILLPQISKAEMVAYIAKRLLDTIEQPFLIKKKELFITASIGIAIYPEDGSDSDVLLKNAENALNQAKAQGCNTYQFYKNDMQLRSKRELLLHSGLHALSIYDELLIEYQPQVNTKEKEISCMEALLRWNHPKLGLIAPVEFIRLAENNGKIIEIGDWVLKKACQQFSQWKAEGFHIQQISVNISLRQLENPRFAFNITQILHENSVSPESLVLEISDKVFQQVAIFEKNLITLKQMGVKLAIDDFGVGHISLQQLSHYAVDYVKIDPYLVYESPINAESEMITKLIIFLSNTLNIGIIAEGVETRIQKEKLESLGCHRMQGYYFSLPRQPNEFTHSLEKSIVNTQ